MRIGIAGAGLTGMALAALLLPSMEQDLRIYGAPSHTTTLLAIESPGRNVQWIDRPACEAARVTVAMPVRVRGTQHDAD